MRWTTRRTKFALVSLTVSLCSALVMADSRRVEELAPQATSAAASVDLAGVLSSPFAVDYFELKRLRNRLVRWVSQFVLGIKLKQVDKVWLLVVEGDSTLVLLEGDFKTRRVARRWRRLSQLEEMEAAGVVQVSKYIDEDDEISTGAEPKTYLAAVMDENWLAAGDEAAVLRLLDVWNNEAPALEAGALAPVLGGSENLRATLLDVTRWQEPDSWIANTLTGADLDAHFTDHLDLSLSLRVADAQAAAGVEHVLKGLLLLGAAHPRIAKNPGLADAVEGARIVNTGDAVSVDLHIDGSALDH